MRRIMRGSVNLTICSGCNVQGHTPPCRATQHWLTEPGYSQRRQAGWSQGVAYKGQSLRGANSMTWKKPTPAMLVCTQEWEMLRHCSDIPAVKLCKQSRLAPSSGSQHPSHIPCSSADITAAHSYSPCLDYLSIPLIPLKHHRITWINISAQEGSKWHSTGQLCITVWTHSTRRRVSLQWSRNPWSPKWKILLVS